MKVVGVKIWLRERKSLHCPGNAHADQNFGEPRMHSPETYKGNRNTSSIPHQSSFLYYQHLQKNQL